MKTLFINATHPYPIYMAKDLLSTTLLKEYCMPLNKRLVIITDSHLGNGMGKSLQQTLKKQGLEIDLLIFPAGENHKTRETKQHLENLLLQKNYGRDTCLIALGGGVVSDLVGFLGATYCRGIPVIYIPTTLLAMVDASIGGKTGVNTPQGKNLIGTFTPPQAVFMDTNTLKPLPQQEKRNGFVEIIKHSLIADPLLFDLLQKNSHQLETNSSDFLMDVIHTSCLIKKNIVEHDEHEKDIRKLLNFGHTIGHAIEAIENYHISHGEAVAIGILVESYLSIQCGYMHEENLKRIQNIFQEYQLPLKTLAFQDKELFKKTLMMDKKSIQNIPQFVMLKNIGQPYFQQNQYTFSVDALLLDQVLDWANTHFS